MKSVKEKMRNLADKFINYETCMYLLFGVLTTAVDWLVYHLLLQTGLSYGYKTLFAWTAAVLFAFVSNKLVVFKSLDFQLKNMAKELFLFVGARIASLFLQLGGMYLLFSVLGMREYPAKALVAVLVIIANYIFSKCFIFRKDEGRVYGNKK